MTDGLQGPERPTQTATPTPQPYRSRHLLPRPGRRRVGEFALAALVAIAAAVTLPACGKPSQTGSAPTTANASDNSFTVSVPAGWRPEESKNPRGWPEDMKRFQVLYLTSDSHDQTINVMALPAGSLSLQQWAQSAMYGAEHGFHAVVDPGDNLQPTTVGGEAALRSSFTAPQSPATPTASHDQQYAVLRGSVGYIITFTSKPDEYTSATADFDAIVHSWKWSTSQPATTVAPAEAALDKLLLSPDQINTAMGTTGMTAGNGQPDLAISVGPVSNTNGTLSTTKTTQGANGVTCQRALTVANNVAIDIGGCRQNRSASHPDSAVNIAHQIAAKVPN